MFFKMLIEVGHSNFEVKESITFRLANFSDWGLVFGYTIFILKPGLSNALFSRSIHVKATKLNSWIIWWKFSRAWENIWDCCQWFKWREDISGDNSLWGLPNPWLESTGDKFIYLIIQISHSYLRHWFLPIISFLFFVTSYNFLAQLLSYSG